MNVRQENRLSHNVRRQLDAVRKSIRTYVILDGMLLAALWLLTFFWLGGLLDYLPVTVGSSETPTWLRGALLATIFAGMAWFLLWRAGRRLLAQLPDKHLAVLLERRFPELNNELVTAVELISGPPTDVSNPGAYQSMLSQVHNSISQRVGDLPTNSLFNWQPIKVWSAATALLVVVTAVAMIGVPDWVERWSRRLFALSTETWPRRSSLKAEGVQLQLPAFSGQLTAERRIIPFENSLARVPRGASSTLLINADSQAKEVPALCTLFYRATDGARGRANMRRVGGNESGWQLFTLDGPPLDGLSTNLAFDIVGNDARLRDLKLQVIEPAIANSLELDCCYPKYLLDSFSSRPECERLVYRAGLVIPDGTDVMAVGVSSSQLSQVQYILIGAANSPETLANADSELNIRSLPAQGNSFKIPLGVLRTSLVLEVRLIDQYGLSAAQVLRYVINVAADTAPEVDTRLVGIGTAITPRAALPIKGTIADDHGISRAWVELAAGELKTQEIDLSIHADNRLESTIDLEQIAAQRSYALQPGMTLSLLVSAQDRFNLGDKPHVGLGQPQQLAVVTDDKLLVILDRQELELRQRLELIIGELAQLREALQDLSTINSTGENDSKAVQSAGDPAQAGSAPSAAPPSDEASDSHDASDQLRRLAVLRAQQSVLQGDKSQQELVGIANRVDNIRLQLVNNKIDSPDRQIRLLQRVHAPLKQALENEVEKMRTELGGLQSSATSTAEVKQPAMAAIAAVERLIIALEAIKANMLDIESYNEIIDLVRILLEDEEQLLDATQKQQKQRLLDLLK